MPRTRSETSRSSMALDLPPEVGDDSLMPAQMHGTTIVTARKGTRVAIAGDGQVSLGQTIIKSKARKVRSLHGGKVIAGFAGSTADALTLFERFEAKLKELNGQLV